MDRRRFLPASEGLEQRALLTAYNPYNAYSSNLNSLFGFQLTANLNIPITYQQKELRAQHLPYYLEHILPGRYLPQAETHAISADLMQLISKLDKPPTQVLNEYNYGIRPIVNKLSVSRADAVALNNYFGMVLNAASASPSVINGLQSNLSKLVTQVDTASPQSAFLATNDYSLVLQTALTIGRPMPSPVLPRIARNQGVQADINHIKTRLKHPALVGTYHFHTHIQVITPSGVVVGTTGVQKNNNFKVVISTPLSPGLYQFRLRAYDDGGNLSRVSPIFEIKVTPKPSHTRP